MHRVVYRTVPRVRRQYPQTLPRSFTAWGEIQRQIDPADWVAAATPTIYLEVHGKTSDAAKALYAQLRNVTTGLVVSPVMSTIATSKTRVRSAAFSLTAGANLYQVEFGGYAGATYTLYDAVLIVDVA